MSLENVKVLLDVDNERVNTIYNMYSNRLISRLQRDLTEVVEIPPQLEYVLTECTIARYNRIGSEGMESESMDGHSAKYIDKDLNDYESEILDYIHSQSEVIEPELSTGKVRFF